MTEHQVAPAGQQERVIRRKSDYSPRPWRGDLFVIRRLRRYISDALDRHVRPGSRVLDLGCGEQPWRSYIEQLGGVYTGADIVQNHAQTVDVLAPSDRTPLPSGTIDVLLCTEVLEHVPDPDATCREIARLLAPGASVIVTTPFLYPLHEEPHDHQRLTPYGLRHRLDVAGLTITEHASLGNEIEVLATVWCNLWSRGLPKALGPLRLAVLAALRLPVNLIAWGLSAALHELLPRKAFLSVVAIGSKPADGSRG